MKNRTTIRANDEASKSAMRIGQKPRAPVMRRRERNLQRAKLDRLPFIELVHNVEPKSMDQTPDADRNNNRLIGRNRRKRSPIEMIEMRVGHENEINRRQMMNVKSGFLQSLDHAQPHRPNRIDQNVGFVGLNQKRGVPDPGNANLARLDFGEERARVSSARTFGKKRRNPDAGDEVALGPIAARTKFYPL